MLYAALVHLIDSDMLHMIFVKRKFTASQPQFVEACQNLRQYESEPQSISPQNVEYLIERACLGSRKKNEIYRSSICGQALINAGQSHVWIASSIERIANLCKKGGTEAALSPLAEMLDLALFETYRDANPLTFSAVEQIIFDVEELLDREEISPSPSGDRSIFYYFHFLLVPLLNTEHQTAVSKVVTRMLLSWDLKTWAKVMPIIRIDVLRKCISQPRLVLDATAIAQVRAAARMQAGRQANQFRCELQDKNADFCRFTRNLILSSEADEVKHLLESGIEIAEAGTAKMQTDFINFISYAHESVLDVSSVVAAEDAFKRVEFVPNAFQYLTMCRRLGDEKRGQLWLEFTSNTAATLARRFVETQYYNAIGRFDLALQMSSRPLSTFSSAYRSNSFGRVLPAVLYRLVREAQTAKFFCDVDKLARSSSNLAQKSGKKVDKSLILVPAHVNFTIQTPIHAVEAARAEGVEVSCMIKGMYPAVGSLHLATDFISQSLVAPYFFHEHNASHEISSEWYINFDERKAIFKGVNFFAGLMNSLGIIFRRFTIDSNDPYVKIHIDRHLVMFQSVFETFRKFVELSEAGRQYRFAVVGIQYGIGYALRRLIEAEGRPNIRILHVSNGFEGFDDKWRTDELTGNPLASFHSVRDLTGKPSTPLGFRPSPSDIDNIDGSPDTLPRSLITQSYVEKVMRRYDASQPLQSTVDQTGMPPRKVLILGTVLPDLSIPEDRGFVHRDLKDWVESTVSIAERNNIQLLVKQHPAELNHKIGFYISERFADLIPSGAENVDILPYETNFYDGLKSVDLVVMWAGTSAVELALLDQPFVCCSVFANEEYPLGMDGPASLSDYEEIMTGLKPWNLPSGIGEIAKKILDKTNQSPFREESILPKRQLLNAQVWPPTLGDFDNESVPEEHHRLVEALIG